ncbi:hypothetical protein Aduo_005122 [Ancylostoma duodenale]
MIISAVIKVLSLLEVFLPTVLIALVVALERFQQPWYMSYTDSVVRGLPSAGLFSVFASFCPPSKQQYDVNGFVVINGSREYEFLELLDKISEGLIRNSTRRKSAFTLDRLLILSRDFEKTLESEGLLKACNISLQPREWEECLSKRSSSVKKINDSFAEFQREIQLANRETQLLDNLAAMADIIQAPSNGTRTSNYLFQLLNQIVCGGELSNATAGQGGGNINNNQLSRLEILEAMLQRNAKILFAPNVTVVEEVISKANETLALVYELNEFVQTAAEILNKSGSQNDTYAAIKKVVLSPRTREFVKKYFGENALPDLLPRVSHKNQTKILEKWISAANQQGMDASYPSFIGFKNESMLEAFAKDADQEDITVVAGIVFDNVDEKNKTLGPVVNYKIRQKPSFTPSTEAVRDLFAVFAGPRDWDDSYYSYGFLWLQDVIERSIISIMVDIPIVEPGAGMQEMAFPCFRYNRKKSEQKQCSVGLNLHVFS